VGPHQGKPAIFVKIVLWHGAIAGVDLMAAAAPGSLLILFMTHQLGIGLAMTAVNPAVTIEALQTPVPLAVHSCEGIRVALGAVFGPGLLKGPPLFGDLVAKQAPLLLAKGDGLITPLMTRGAPSHLPSHVVAAVNQRGQRIVARSAADRGFEGDRFPLGVAQPQG